MYDRLSNFGYPAFPLQGMFLFGLSLILVQYVLLFGHSAAGRRLSLDVGGVLLATLLLLMLIPLHGFLLGIVTLPLTFRWTV